MNGRRARSSRRIGRKRIIVTVAVIAALILLASAAALFVSGSFYYAAVTENGELLGSYTEEEAEALSAGAKAIYGEINDRFGTSLSPRFSFHRRLAFFGCVGAAEPASGQAQTVIGGAEAVPGAEAEVSAEESGTSSDAWTDAARELVLRSDSSVTSAALISIGGSPVACTGEPEAAAEAVTEAERAVCNEIEAALPGVTVSPATEVSFEELLCPVAEQVSAEQLYTLLTGELGEHPLLVWARETIASADASLAAAEEYYKPLVDLRRYRTLFPEETGGYEAAPPAVSPVLGTERPEDNADADDMGDDVINVNGDYYRSESARALLSVELTREQTEYISTDYDSITELRADRPSGYSYPRRAGVRGIASVTSSVTYLTDGGITRSGETEAELVAPIAEILLVGEGSGGVAGEATGELIWPLETTDMYVSSLFQEVREAFDSRTGYHIGVDLQIDEGEPVWAADGGTVILAEEHLTYGLLVEIDHGNGLVSFYGHLSDISVAVGDKVAPCDIIGHVGDTGAATSAHLHFELRREDIPVDPFDYLPDIPVNYMGEKVSSRGLDAGQDA